jgi:hypothetical protein
LIRIISCRHDTLAKNLPNEEKHNLRHAFKVAKFNLLTKKGIFPYEWFNSLNKFDSTELPEKEAFKEEFNGTIISEEDYSHAQKVWKTFKCRTFLDYHKLYLETNVLLLADILDNFRNTCLENYSLDPCYYYTSPGLSLDAMLKMTAINLELLTGQDMYMFFEPGIRGVICVASYRYANAYNKLFSYFFCITQLFLFSSKQNYLHIQYRNA